MNNKVISLESNKYELKLDNFEGPLDLLVYLIDKNKMNIYEVNLSELTNQYIKYIKEQERLNLEIASEFLVMASTLLLIKSKGLLPKDVDDEAELTEEELLRRILEYKKYKEITNVFRDRILIYSKRYYKLPDHVELPKQSLDQEFTMDDIVRQYQELIQKNQDKINENAKNIEKIAMHDTYSVSEKVREIFKELVNKPKFIFGKLFSLKEKPKAEVVTAFSGVLELSRRNRINADQEKLFGDIIISKRNDVKDSDYQLDKLDEIENEIENN